MIPSKDQQHFSVDISYWISTGLGTGLANKAPGTAGSLLAAFLAFLLSLKNIDPSFTLKTFIILTITLVGYLCIEICRQNLDGFSDKDPQKITIDEIAGYFSALLISPLTVSNIILAFILFRFFDILKPGLIGWADKQEGSFAVILDDLIAGLHAALLLFAINWLINYL